MSSVELSDEVLARLRAEATRRGVTVETVIAELAAQLPANVSVDGANRLSFAGIGASGTTEPVGRRHREIIAEHFADKTARDV